MLTAGSGQCSVANAVVSAGGQFSVDEIRNTKGESFKESAQTVTKIQLTLALALTTS